MNDHLSERDVWSEIAPDVAVTRFPDGALGRGVTLPFNEMGEECPWPWEPQQLVGAPLGQYHCPYCGAMVMAGMPHLDYGPTGDLPPEMTT